MGWAHSEQNFILMSVLLTMMSRYLFLQTLDSSQEKTINFNIQILKGKHEKKISFIKCLYLQSDSAAFIDSLLISSLFHTVPAKH
jgi:hypothetical protein